MDNESIKAEISVFTDAGNSYTVSRTSSAAILSTSFLCFFISLESKDSPLSFL